MRDVIDPTSFLYAGNGTYLADLYRQFIEQPDSLPVAWRAAFADFGLDKQSSDLPSAIFGQKRKDKNDHDRPTGITSHQAIIDSVRALMIIHAYRVRGHLLANLDPLQRDVLPHPDLQLDTYGFGPQDMDREIYLDGSLGFTVATLRQIIEKLQQIYCQTVGIEFMHIQDPQQRLWIQESFEQGRPSFDNEQKKELWHHLIKAETFERFLHVKFPGAKRFGLEGCESLIPALEALLAHVSQQGVRAVDIGMAHRGRLNILANIIHKPLSKIFAQFRGVIPFVDNRYGSGDVKYHLGYSGDRVFDGNALHLSLASNPSHLESVNPVVLGKVRAKQDLYDDTQRQHFMGLLVHGDAAFAGQGIVAETLALSNLKGFHTGGTFHIIINNQIGFTTSPPYARSSPYSSDGAKAIQAPIIHVNGDDPEAVVSATLIAENFRRQFARDVVVDILCYRRHGHNESDEPRFTQPLMYQAIDEKETTASLYQRQLLEAGLLTEADVTTARTTIEAYLREAFEKTIEPEELIPQSAQSGWSTIKQPLADDEKVAAAMPASPIQTGVKRQDLQNIGHAVLPIPDAFALHPKIARQFELKKQHLDDGEAIDWAMAEILAFGSLLQEGVPIRLSGQDSARGTFSQRHAVLTDQRTEERYVPLSQLATTAQTTFEIIDSPLAEASVLGFEYGYSTINPHGLVLWEAQFGDFANGAQVIIDQFIASGEAKWLRLSGLVLLLPHGFEGQGPEHSSARLERFLQLCAESNLCVVNCSTPANYFHVLRRQIRNQCRKPLILLTPKSLLRHPQAISSLKEMDEESTFQTVIADTQASAALTQRVVICNGKVYYDLLAEREKRGLTTIALIRLEQFYPFPYQEIKNCLAPFKHAEMVWCQEEPMNMGAWTFIDRRMEALLKDMGGRSHDWRGVGRPPAAAPATGFLSRHVQEQQKLIDEALTLTTTAIS